MSDFSVDSAFDSSLVDSVLASVGARGGELGGEDSAAVGLAVRYAQQIDAAIDEGGYAATKGLYLGSLLLKVLGDLGCTPMGRAELKKKAGKVSSGGKSVGVVVGDDLAEKRRQYRGRGA